jgi:hypothetical protein
MENTEPAKNSDQKSLKLTIEASNTKEINSLRNEDSLFSSKKKKKKLIKSKFDEKKNTSN